MKKWKCKVCQHVHTGDNPPDKCPICGVSPRKFVLMSEEENQE